jgi:hypothetical protein
MEFQYWKANLMMAFRVPGNLMMAFHVPGNLMMAFHVPGNRMMAFHVPGDLTQQNRPNSFLTGPLHLCTLGLETFCLFVISLR